MGAGTNIYSSRADELHNAFGPLLYADGDGEVLVALLLPDGIPLGDGVVTRQTTVGQAVDIATDPDALRELARARFTGRILEKLADNPATPGDVVDRLWPSSASHASETRKAVAQKVAGRRDASTFTLRDIATDGPWEARLIALLNPRMLRFHFDRLAPLVLAEQIQSGDEHAEQLAAIRRRMDTK